MGGEGVAERAIANEHEVDGGVKGGESGELGEELIEAMPRDEPADEADDQGIGWGEALADGGAVGGGEEGSGVDGIGEDENFFFGDAEGDDAALEVWRDDDDAAGVLESEAIGEAREWEEPGGGADAFVAGEFVDFDDEGDVAVVGEEDMPEGTRAPLDTRPPLQSGFAGLYRILNLPVVPVAVRSGHAFTRHGAKHPGVVDFVFGDPIPPGLPRDQIEAKVHAAINALVQDQS